MLIRYIKKDVNKILLFLTIIPIILFLSYSTYYDNQLKNMSVEYSENLKGAAGNVVLENQSHLKEAFQKDKEAIEKQYYDLRAENEGLKTDKERLQEEMDSLKSQLEGQKAKFDLLQSRFNEVQNALIETNEQISRLAAKNRELCGKVKDSNPDEKC